MQHYVGLDLSVKETSVCIIDKALNGKRFLCQNREDRHQLGCDLDLADHFARALETSKARIDQTEIGDADQKAR
jgi:hypothetical protein